MWVRHLIRSGKCYAQTLWTASQNDSVFRLSFEMTSQFAWKCTPSKDSAHFYCTSFCYKYISDSDSLFHRQSTGVSERHVHWKEWRKCSEALRRWCTRIDRGKLSMRHLSFSRIHSRHCFEVLVNDLRVWRRLLLVVEIGVQVVHWWRIRCKHHAGTGHSAALPLLVDNAEYNDANNNWNDEEENGNNDTHYGATRDTRRRTGHRRTGTWETWIVHRLVIVHSFVISKTKFN